VVQKRNKSKLISVGLDGDSEELRITRSEDFLLVGGSKDTHEQMQEKCIKFTEKVRQTGKTMEGLDRREFLDIAEQCDMRVVEIKPKGGRAGGEK